MLNHMSRLRDTGRSYSTNGHRVSFEARQNGAQIRANQQHSDWLLGSGMHRPRIVSDLRRLRGDPAADAG